MTSNSRWLELCRLDEITPGSCRGFTAAETGSISIFVVRQQSSPQGYINRCPHTGAPLDWLPHQFLSLDERHIQCAMHAALFTIDEGACVQGPCRGEQLTPIELAIENGIIYWTNPPAATG